MIIKTVFFFTGLWVVCFKDFEDTHHWYDTKFSSCWWVFEEEYYIIYDILFKGVCTTCFTVIIIIFKLSIVDCCVLCKIYWISKTRRFLHCYSVLVLRLCSLNSGWFILYHTLYVSKQISRTLRANFVYSRSTLHGRR